MCEINAVKVYLRDVANRYKKESNNAKVLETTKELKANAVQAENQDQAKQIWCYEQILRIQNNYSTFAVT